MNEREFQNMFIFSSGFEAATLKIPTEEDSNGRKQIVSVIILNLEFPYFSSHHL